MSATFAVRPEVSATFGHSTGWLFEREDRGFLMLTRTRFRAERFDVANGSLDPRGWLSIRNQGPLRSSCGMALATCVEVVHWLKSGRTVGLSGTFAYMVAQKLSGTLGRDSGATVCGTVKAAKVFGVCREKIVPESQSYCDTFSVRARRNARRFRVVSHSMLGNYGDVFHFLAAGLGSVLLAVPWRESLAFAGGVLDQDDGRSLGCHTIAVVGIDDRLRDDNGRPYLIAANSHGRRWGDDGFAVVAPRLFDNWGSRADALMVGLSDQDTYKVRSTKHPGAPGCFGFPSTRDRDC